MSKVSFFTRSLILALLASGCSIEVEQASVMTPSVERAPPTSSSTAIFPATEMPIIWGNLNLTGKLIYLSSVAEGDTFIAKIYMLDLSTGDLATILSVPDAWVFYATVSPDARNLVLSYTPPAQANETPIRILYIMPLDGSAPPRPLFTPPDPAERYIQAEWSPDGKYIYYVRYNVNDPMLIGPTPDYDIVRMAYPNGQPEELIEHAFWPRLSPDSTRLVYASQDLNSDRNELFLASADGSKPQRVEFTGSLMPEIVDAPIFSPDGQSILFSVPSPVQSYEPNWFDNLLGTQVAKAHSIPSDWWSVPATGGAPTQLTNIQTINLFGSISPDEKYIASVSREGLFVMDLNGSSLTQLIQDLGVHGTVSWIP